MPIETIEQIAPLLLTLDDSAATLEQVGGKGASLARMAAAGLPVPPGFHITTAAYRRFVDANGLQKGILAAVTAAQADVAASLELASARIQMLFTAAIMPDDLAGAISQAYQSLGGDTPVAVRSSATAEDLPGLSFAGQQETYLNIHGDEAVLEAVKKCWASLWTARAIGYRLTHQVAQESVAMAVVVQQLVAADAAGIMFTANPVDGRRDEVLINAAWGLGEAVVGGLVMPDALTLDKESGKVVEQQINTKEVMTVRSGDGTREEPVPAELRTKPVLTSQAAAELARLGVEIERMYGQPMDIEWALQESRVLILQARPITALPQPPVSAAEWILPDPKGTYVRSSVLELLPDPLSPLFATLGLHAFSQAMAAMLRSFGVEGFMTDRDALIAINGYGYYDLSYTPLQAAKAAAAMPRFLTLVPSLLPSARTRWQDERRHYQSLVERWDTADLAALPVTALLEGVCEITDEAAEYYITIQTGILPAAYMTEALFTAVYDKLCKRAGDPVALVFMLGYDSAPIRAEKSLFDLAQWVQTDKQLAAALTDMSGEDFATLYQEHAERQIGAAGAVNTANGAEGAWPEFWSRFTRHLDLYGHTIYDLDFAKAVPADDPAPLLATLKFFIGGEAQSPYARQAAAAQQRERATTELLARLPGPTRGWIGGLMGAAQRFAPLREDALADVGLGWPILRRIVREIGRRLAAAGGVAMPSDAFWLELEELRAAAAALDGGSSPQVYKDLVAERRATWEHARAVKPPMALPVQRGVRYLGIDFTNWMPERGEQPTGAVLHGVAGSPGVVTGTARVIHGPDEFGQMRRGDILVARITTPAWTPLFALAAGVVTDVGGPLSHSSIVAREYHIPAVLGTGTATERLQGEQRVTVDGNAGTVAMLDVTGTLENIPVEAQPAGKARRLSKAKAGVLVALAAITATAGVMLWRRRRR